MSQILKKLFEGTMESMFVREDWKDVLPIRQQLELEDIFMSGAQATFIEIMRTKGGCVEDLDNELKDFGQRIIKRYEDAGIDLTDANKKADEYLAAKAAKEASKH